MTRKEKPTQPYLKCNRAAASDSFAVCPVFFCGLAGFSDFYKPEWLQWIIRRQDKDLGCFVQDGECVTAEQSSHPNPFKQACRCCPLTSQGQFQIRYPTTLPDNMPVSKCTQTLRFCDISSDLTSLMSVEKLLEQPHAPHSRVKRREKVLPGQLFLYSKLKTNPSSDKRNDLQQQLCPADGCSSHTTSVAVGALGGYLGFYLTEQDITKRPLP